MVMEEGRRRRKRLSKSIHELSGRFGEGGDMQSSNQPGIGCKEGEGLEASSSSLKILPLSKLESGLEDTHSDISVGITKPTFHQFSNQNNISSNHSSLLMSTDTQTNQGQARGVKRKGNWTMKSGGLLKKEKSVVT